MNAALTITGLTKKYSHFTLDNISFSIPSGSIVGLIGENGAGKSTTINSILGLIKKDSGKITILGHDAENLDDAVKEKIGVVFDGSNFSEELTPVEFVQDEDHSILVSSHITSDLEKVADYIVFVHAGKIIFCEPKDELLERFGMIKCGAAQYDAMDRKDIVAYRKQDYEWQVLVADRKKAAKKYPKAMIIPATIDEIMLLYVKGETA